MNYILTDIDETVLQFAQPFEDWMHEIGYEANGKLRDNYCMEKTYGISKNIVMEKLFEFCDTEMYRNLPAEECAKIIIPRLHEQGFKFIGISACDEKAHEHRLYNFKEEFGFELYELYCVGMLSEKKEILKKFEPSIWVEDHWKNACDGSELGHTSFLLTREYNRNENSNNINRVSSWFDIYDYIHERIL